MEKVERVAEFALPLLRQVYVQGVPEEDSAISREEGGWKRDQGERTHLQAVRQEILHQGHDSRLLQSDQSSKHGH